LREFFNSMGVRKPSSASTQAKILLVDDNAQGVAARKTVLEELGYRITATTSGEEALELFGRQKFDLVVTDYKMPRLDGLELIAHLRKRAPELPIILVSGYVDTLGLSEESTSADAVIQKSANEVSHLVRAVARLLRQKPVPKPATSAGTPLKAKRKTV
jgi:CheY-like chemotaxis protein